MRTKHLAATPYPKIYEVMETAAVARGRSIWLLPPIRKYTRSWRRRRARRSCSRR